MSEINNLTHVDGVDVVDKKPKQYKIFKSGAHGSVSLVEVLGNNKSIKYGIYIRYCDKGGTDTTTEKWLSDIPKGLVLASETPKQTGIDELPDVFGTDQEAFEAWSKDYYGHGVSLFNVLYQSTDGRYNAHFIQTDWEVWQAGGTSKQAEIDKLRAELAQARGQRDSYLDKAIERVRKCELPQRDVMRIRLDEAVGGLIILRDELLKQTKID